MDGSISVREFIETYIQTKGLKLDQLETLRFHFRGSYARGNDAIAFTGDTDLSGNGLLKLAAWEDHDKLTYRNGELKKRANTLDDADSLALQSLAYFLDDPLIEYALSPEEFIAHIYTKDNHGVKVIAIELVHLASNEKFSIVIDTQDLQIKEISKKSELGEITLRYYSHKCIDGVILPTGFTVRDNKGIVLIDIAEISRRF